jgi:hypothetical protein
VGLAPRGKGLSIRCQTCKSLVPYSEHEGLDTRDVGKSSFHSRQWVQVSDNECRRKFSLDYERILSQVRS